MTNKKRKTKTIIKKVFVKPTEDTKKVASEVREEISELERKKQQTGTGIRSFLRKASINREIYEKKKFLTAGDKIKATTKATELAKKQLELQEARAKLGEFKKKSSVNFEGLGEVNTGFKPLKFEDLY